MITNDLLLLKDHLTNILSGFTKTGTGQLQNLLTEFIESMSHISKEPEKKNLYIEIRAQMNKISLLETKRYSALRNLKAAQQPCSGLPYLRSCVPISSIVSLAMLETPTPRVVRVLYCL